MRYYSIRVVEAQNTEEAIQEVIDQNFHEDDSVCDKVLTRSQLLKWIITGRLPK